MMFLRRAEDKDRLVQQFFGSTDAMATARIISVWRTWASALYTILSVEEWWVSPANLKYVRSAGEVGEGVLAIAD